MNKVTQEMVDELMGAAEFQTMRLGNKTTVMVAILPNGFEITESSSCVDPANYDEAIGANICRGRIAEKVWELAGYQMQCELAGRERAQGTQGDSEPDFKERVRIEKKELAEKIVHLTAFIEHAAIFASLTSDEKYRLKKQKGHMVDYAMVLSARIAALDE